MTIQMQAIEQYFPVVPFTTQGKVVLLGVDEILKCGHSIES